MCKKLPFLLVVFALFISINSEGQNLPIKYHYVVKRFGDYQGITNKNLLGFVLDKNGLGWLGTSNGLYVFDGNNSYKANNFLKTKNILLDYQITNIHYDEKENILIVFAYYKKKTSIYTVHLSKLGTQTEHQAIELLFESPGQTERRPIYRQNRLTFIVGYKLFVLDLKNCRINRQWKSLEYVSSVVYLEGDGYIAHDKKENKIFRVIVQNNKLKLIFKKYIDYQESNILFRLSGITCINNKYIKNSVWARLCSFEPIAKIVGLETEYINSVDVVQDKSGNYYLYGVLGLQRISYIKDYIFPLPIEKNETRAIWYNETQKTGLIATAIGIFNFVLNPPKIENYQISNKTKSYYNVYIKKDTSVIFFPLYFELYKTQTPAMVYYPNRGIMKQLKIVTSPQISKLEGEILEIQSSIKTTDGAILLGTNQSLCIAKPAKDSVYILPTGICNNDAINNIIPSYTKGSLILATESGLYEVNINTKKTKQLYKGIFLSLSRYKDGWIAGSRGLGVLFFNKKNQLIAHVNVDNGLPSNTVYSIIYDAKFQTAWLGTENGLVLYHLLMGILKVYTTIDNTASNEFNRNSSLTLPGDSTLLLGGVAGLTTIRNREPFYKDTSGLKPHIWGVSIVDKDNKNQYYFIKTGKFCKLISKLPNNLKKIIIQTTFFASQKHLYGIAYKIDDDKWRYISAASNLELLGISPGDHTVIIKAVTADMQESEPVELQFTIIQVWYNSIWGGGVFVLLGICIMLPIMYIRLKYIQMQASIEISKNKEQFFAIIAHDLRSPMKAYQSINEVIDYLIQIEDWERLKQVGKEIDTTSRKLDKMIENLLDWSMLQQEEIKPVFQFINVESHLQDLLPIYRVLAQNKDIQLIENLEIKVPIFTDINLLNLIVRNLLDNSIKYTPAHCKIHFNVKQINYNLILLVENNFEKNTQELLINLAEGITQSKLHFEKGLGLKLISQSIKLLNGKIKVRVVNDTNLIVWEILIPIQI